VILQILEVIDNSNIKAFENWISYYLQKTSDEITRQFFWSSHRGIIICTLYDILNRCHIRWLLVLSITLNGTKIRRVCSKANKHGSPMVWLFSRIVDIFDHCFNYTQQILNACNPYRICIYFSGRIQGIQMKLSISDSAAQVEIPTMLQKSD